MIKKPRVLKLVKIAKHYYYHIDGRYDCLICGKKVKDKMAYYDTTSMGGWFHRRCVLG